MPEPHPYSRDSRGKKSSAPVAPGGVGPRMGNEEDFSQGTASNKSQKTNAGGSGGVAAYSRQGSQKRGGGSTSQTRRGLTRSRSKTRQALRLKRRMQEKIKQGAKPKKKLTGWAFYVVLGLAAFKDLFDVLANFLVVVSWGAIIYTALLACVVVPYYYLNGVRPNTKKIVMWTITGVIAVIPYVNLLPTMVLNVWLTRIMMNSELVQAVAGRMSVKSNVRRTARRNIS